MTKKHLVAPLALAAALALPLLAFAERTPPIWAAVNAPVTLSATVNGAPFTAQTTTDGSGAYAFLHSPPGLRIQSVNLGPFSLPTAPNHLYIIGAVHNAAGLVGVDANLYQVTSTGDEWLQTTQLTSNGEISFDYFNAGLHSYNHEPLKIVVPGKNTEITGIRLSGDVGGSDQPNN